MSEPASQSPGAISPSFMEELAASWRQLPDKPLFFGLLAVWMLLFQCFGNSTLGYVNTASLYAWMNMVYMVPSSEDSHGMFIPFVVVVLLWFKKEELLRLPSRIWLPGLGLLAGAAVLHFLGFLVQQPRISIFAMFAGVYALIGLVWGPGWLRASFFPICLFAFCIPMGSLADGITFPLRMVATKLSVGVAHHVLGIDVVRDGSRIFASNHSFQYDVAPACSGIRSLISLTAFTTIYAFLVFKTTGRRLFFVVLAVPLAVIGNVARITTVIVTARLFGQAAGAKIETNLGFVTFGIAIAVVFTVGHWLREPKPEAVKA